MKNFLFFVSERIFFDQRIKKKCILMDLMDLGLHVVIFVLE